MLDSFSGHALFILSLYEGILEQLRRKFEHIQIRRQKAAFCQTLHIVQCYYLQFNSVNQPQFLATQLRRQMKG